MLFKTKGIVLSFIKYSETSIITKIYTAEFGLQSYIVNGVRNKNSKTKIALFQPLTLLDLVVYHKNTGGIQRISELKCNYPFKSIPFDLHKSSIGIFLAEVLSKTLKEDYSNPALFDFLNHSIATFDDQKDKIENFHLKFLIDFAGYLGFMPTRANDITTSGHIKSPTNEELEFLDSLISSSEIKPINNSTRRVCMDYILEFYSYHVENFGTLNSVRVLKEVLSN